MKALLFLLPVLALTGCSDSFNNVFGDDEDNSQRVVVRNQDGEPTAIIEEGHRREPTRDELVDLAIADAQATPTPEPEAE